jgi:hypothetical protein
MNRYMKLAQPTVSLGVVLSLVGVLAASAQEETGALYGTFSNAEGEGLPRVSVSLTGMGASRLQVTDAHGKYRFLALDVGLYELSAALDGFSAIEYPQIDIRAGRKTTINLQLFPAINELITVTAESPLLDERKVARGSILTQVDLETIPTSRDPWSVMNQAPGVLLDRVNVGGNEGARQGAQIAPAAGVLDNDYLVDGVEITDMAFGGTSPRYYDFAQFAQFEISTGGSEITKLAPGISINMVTKRGTNEFRGSARFFLTDDDGYFGILKQGTPSIESSELGPGQEEALTGNRTDRIEDYGFEAGGPAWPDRVWLWTAWGTNPMRTFTVDGQPDIARLENVALKLNAQVSTANSLIVSWSNGLKTSPSRGAGLDTAPEATLTLRGSSDLLKVEDTHLFGGRLLLTGRWSKSDGGFQYTGNGGVGPEAPETLLDADGVWRRNNQTIRADRPSDELSLGGSVFLGTRATSHELEFGVRNRSGDYGEITLWPGRQLIHYARENLGTPFDAVGAHRGGAAPAGQDISSIWLQDTVTRGRWTLNAGLRWDLQEGSNEADTVAANPAFPEVLPAVRYAGDDDGGFEWETLCPRLSVTYALGEERRTLLRASYARFAERLNGRYFNHSNPLSNAYAYLGFFDANENNMWDSVEIDGATFLLFCEGVDCSDPTAVETPNLTDPGLDAPTTDELGLTVEHSILPEFVVGLDVMYRYLDELLDSRALIRDASGAVRPATRDDYVFETTVSGEFPDGVPFASDFYALEPGLQFTGGTLLTNGDRTREYFGATLSATKRLSNQWMLRGYVHYGRPKWNIPGSFFYWDDPTDAAGGAGGINLANMQQDNDGDLYFEYGKWGGLLQSSWAFNVNGMYQLAPNRPWGFNIAGNLYGRQGYPLAYWVQYVSRLDGLQRRADAVSSADQFRTDDVYTLDLRLEKEFAVSNAMGLTFSIDAFNVLNESTVLRRDLNLSGPRSDFIDETLAPRIYRLGVRLSWR